MWILLNSAFSLDEIAGNSVLFFSAGYDTTANTLTFFCYHMAMNPKIQEKCREEIDRVLAKVHT